MAPLQFHAWIEFGNRLINAAVTDRRRSACSSRPCRRAPRRRDLTLLSVGLLVGLLAEVVLGGLVVKHKLAPGLVMAHFLLGVGVPRRRRVLHHRAALPTTTPAGPGCRWWGGPSAPVPADAGGDLAVVVTLGTIVTSTGPHGGSPDVRRFGFSLHTVAQLHGTSVEVFLADRLVLLWSLARAAAPRPR